MAAEHIEKCHKNLSNWMNLSFQLEKEKRLCFNWVEKLAQIIAKERCLNLQQVMEMNNINFDKLLSSEIRLDGCLGFDQNVHPSSTSSTSPASTISMESDKMIIKEKQSENHIDNELFQDYDNLDCLQEEEDSLDCGFKLGFKNTDTNDDSLINLQGSNWNN